jgi:tetratricopeptide (TPR) repeat protein
MLSRTDADSIMDRQRDIYRSPGADKKPDQDPVSVDMTPEAMRSRTRRTLYTFLAVMLLFLGAAWFVGSMLEKEDEGGPDGETPLVMPGEDLETSESGVMLATPQIADVAEQLMLSRDEVAPTLDHNLISEAMKEVRVAADYLKAREWDGAEIHSRRALELWPDMNAALRLLGFVYLQRGQFDQAVAILEHSLRGNPFNAEAFNNLATAYMQKLEFEKAEDLLVTAMNVQPEFIPAQVNLGLLYALMGRYEETIDCLGRALQKIPENASARNNLAVALIRVNRYDEARSHLEEIIERQPGRATAYFNVAITYVYERNLPDAMRYIEMGSKQCSPMQCVNYLNDSDFDPLRGHPAFKQFIRNLYPDVPQLPEIHSS